MRTSFTIRGEAPNRYAELILMRRLIETYHDWALETGTEIPEPWRDRHLDRPCFWHSLLEALMGPKTLAHLVSNWGGR